MLRQKCIVGTVTLVHNAQDHDHNAAVVLLTAAQSMAQDDQRESGESGIDVSQEGPLAAPH
jgi:hypothetical protein